MSPSTDVRAVIWREKEQGFDAAVGQIRGPFPFWTRPLSLDAIPLALIRFRLCAINDACQALIQFPISSS